MRLFLPLILLVSICQANTISDVFHESQNNCQYSYTPPYSNCDVIGVQASFDIDRADVTITQGWIDVTLYLNYGNGHGLTAFSVGGPTLLPADVFFYDPANPQVYSYGVPIVNHGDLLAGNLYAAASPPLTALQVLGGGSDYYRRNQQVWLPSGEPLVAQGTGVGIIDRGLSDSHGQYAVSIHIPTPSNSFWEEVLAGNEVGVAFASATCANDVLAGVVAVGAPEPGAFVLSGAGLALLVCVRLRKRNNRVGARVA
jgi:hypothetical protein